MMPAAVRVPDPTQTSGPLIYRLDANSLAAVAEVMGCTVQELVERYR